MILYLEKFYYRYFLTQIIPDLNITNFSKILSVLLCMCTLFMKSVFEKKLLSILFYTHNHSFIANDFFFKTFIPLLFPYFLWEGTNEPITCSLVLVQPRKPHLDITEKLLTGN